MGNSNSQVMPKVDFEKENLKAAHIYSKYLEAKNFERYTFARAGIRRKRILLGGSLAVIFGIYSFTLMRIKQETYFDDFEEPEIVKN